MCFIPGAVSLAWSFFHLGHPGADPVEPLVDVTQQYMIPSGFMVHYEDHAKHIRQT